MITIRIQPNYDGWHSAARRLLLAGTRPDEVMWDDGEVALLPGLATEPAAETRPERDRQPAHVMVPRRFVTDARWVAAHRDSVRWDVMFRVLWRTLHENRRLLEVSIDPDVARFQAMLADTRRDEHKMRAFVRFRKVDEPDGERFIAWHRPDHHIVPLAAPFFAERFAAMRWSILTPDQCVHWDGAELRFSPGVERSAAPTDDELEELWRAYYAAIFNPARVNVKAMKAEMPVRHWGTLPEAQLIPSLVMDAKARVKTFRDDVAQSARDFIPEDHALSSLKQAAATCQGCPLFQRATQAVFGEGPADARVVLVGEQPGDEEDIKGRPFVGPAGEVLNRALAAAGIAREQVYLTNAVKHFSWEPRGKRRIHQTPRLSEMRACRPWLEAEIEAVRPAVLVALGSTAGRTLFGPQFKVTSERGRVQKTAWAERTLATLHPSAVLRADSQQTADQYFDWIVSDLRLAVSDRVESS